MNNKFSFLAVSFALLISCNNAENTSTAATPNVDTPTNKKDTLGDGWVSLFDRKTTTGWHSYGKDKAGELWKIADGALYLDTSKKAGYQTSGGGDLVSDAEYGNFDLKLEWKIAPKGNSGIVFYIHEDTAKYKESWFTGLEMQVLDNGGHPDGKIPKHRVGDLYDLISCTKETVKPTGEWNEVEIMSKDGKLDLFLNGTNVVTTSMWDDNWKKLVAGSKFKAMADFSTYKKGKIALQDHGNMVWYRNIKIKEL